MQEIQVYGASRRREPLVLVLVLVLVERSRREPSNGAAIESNRWKPSGGGDTPIDVGKDCLTLQAYTR